MGPRLEPRPWWGKRTTDHLAKEFLGGISEERHTAHQEFIEDNTHGPPVHWLPVALTQDHLRRNVLRGPAYLGTESQAGSAS